MGRTLLLLALGFSFCLTTLSATPAGLPRSAADFPLPVDSYHDQQISSLFGKLVGRIQREPLNLVATIIFFAAIIHTFLAAQFRKIAHRYQQSYEAIEYLLHAPDSLPDYGKGHDKLIFRAQLFYFMGEVEAVFGIWLIPLFVAIIAFHGWSTMVELRWKRKRRGCNICRRDNGNSQFAANLSFYGNRDRQSFGSGKRNTRFMVVGDSDAGPVARLRDHRSGCHDDLRLLHCAIVFIASSHRCRSNMQLSACCSSISRSAGY